MRIPAQFERKLLYAAAWAMSDVLDKHCPMQKEGVPPDGWTSEEKMKFDLITETESAITEAIKNFLAEKRK